MAHDSNLRHLRADPPHPRESASASSDPLAELARLIGQNDPFADQNSRDARAPSRQAAQRPQAAAPPEAPEWLSRSSGAAPQGGAEGYYHDQGGYQDPNYPYQDDPRYQDPGYQDSGYQDPRYPAEYQGAYAGDGSTDDPAYGYQSEAYYDDQQGYDDGAYAAPPEKRRGGLMTVAAVVALAVFGTAAALGYRAWTGPSDPGGEPPVIKAEQTPTKVVPAAPSSDSPPGKQVYDRAGDRGGERVVPREEQPIDPRSAAPRPPAQATPNGLPPLAGVAPVPTAVGDAKPVKTVTIRPDQAGVAAAQPQTPQAARPQVAIAPPPAAVRVPTTAIPSTPPRPQVESGGYLVQVASQRSEADAQTSFRVLQQKYPTVLGNQRASIRRVDLGEKGVYYRTNVGPFASVEEANEMCGNLKAAGGQCIVQRN